ncbi:DUF2066 domain-containing protein [Zhongshania sp.]|uniref:DUF2066 domain-containing protein n=1 Tax=Zhongshania sp. TaxID=1971902 RepID=UPI0035619D20
MSLIQQQKRDFLPLLTTISRLLATMAAYDGQKGLKQVKQIIRVSVVLWLFVVAGVGAVMAGTVANLYDEQLVVESQSPESLKKAAAEALERIFVRVSGRGDAGRNAAVAAVLARPEPLITQYRYQRSKDQYGEDILQLSLSFSPRQVNAELQSAGLPVWSANRPAVLVWLLADTAEGRQFVGADSQGELLNDLKEVAQRRGLDLQLPLFDLADSTNLTSDQLWQMSVDDVRRASARYSAPFVLMGRASQFSTGQWIASWMILQGDEVIRLESEGLDGRDLLEGPVNSLADLQASKYSVVATGSINSANSLIHISGVANFAAYADMITYLEGLAVVQHANTVWLSDNELILELVLNDDMEKVKRFLNLDGQLVEEPSSAVVAGITALPMRGFYRWSGKRL